MSDPVAVMIVRQSVATLGREATDTTRLLIDSPTGTHWTGMTVGDLRAVLAYIADQAARIDKALDVAANEPHPDVRHPATCPVCAMGRALTDGGDQ